MNQEKIKDRIFRRAAKLWGYNELEADSSFDPIVGLMLSATASELEKLGFELESSRARITERVLEVLFPEEVSGVMPSRSVLQIFPLENGTRLSLHDHFKIDQKASQGLNRSEAPGKDIYFCPTIEAHLTTARVEYLAHGKVMKMQETSFSTAVLEKSESHMPAGEIWVGIRSSDSGSLDNMMFYIDLNNQYQKELFFHYINQVKVCYNNQEFELVKGYNVDQKPVDFSDVLMKNHLELDYIYQDVNAYYFSRFFTLKQKIEPAEKCQSGELFTRYFPDSKIAEDEDIIWLQFKFPETVEDEVLQNVSIILNCVPVVNIYNTKAYKRALGRLDILPIQSEDHFLALDYVSDDAGRRFDVKNYERERDSISAILRRGGVSRFDHRSASELLQYLLEVIKDETAAFSAIGGDLAREMLVQISQNMAALHQLAQEKNFSYIHNPYLMITGNTSRSETSYNISYWNTQAEEANHIRPGTLFAADQPGSLICERNSVMITSSWGGRKSLSPQDKILSFRTALLSRGRIVTPADIRELAMGHFKDTITDARVEKGTRKEVALKNGFSRTVDVHLFRNLSIGDIGEEEWKYSCESFLLKLENNSTHMLPYRIFEH
ncbi:type VI secretion system baseplate subunit TssF [Chryseobacterium sp. CBSDS_008]|uniref:type VI secretion system baseplate subunit TssF n=1 Tax=Chryseobacterium sp. CBSDS_008 TaxID=3415265 RepID=UPI003CF6ADD0